MPRGRSRSVKPLAAVVLIASFAMWHPAMMACMTGMSMPMEHAASHHGVPQHTAPLDCCCVGACAVALGLPAAASAAVPGGVVGYIPNVAWARFMVVLATPHQRPFAIGPPLPLA